MLNFTPFNQKNKATEQNWGSNPSGFVKQFWGGGELSASAADKTIRKSSVGVWNTQGHFYEKDLTSEYSSEKFDFGKNFYSNSENTVDSPIKPFEKQIYPAISGQKCISPNNISTYSESTGEIQEINIETPKITAKVEVPDCFICEKPTDLSLHSLNTCTKNEQHLVHDSCVSEICQQLGIDYIGCFIAKCRGGYWLDKERINAPSSSKEAKVPLNQEENNNIDEIEPDNSDQSIELYNRLVKQFIGSTDRIQRNNAILIIKECFKKEIVKIEDEMFDYIKNIEFFCNDPTYQCYDRKISELEDRRDLWIQELEENIDYSVSIDGKPCSVKYYGEEQEITSQLHISRDKSQESSQKLINSQNLPVDSQGNVNYSEKSPEDPETPIPNPEFRIPIRNDPEFCVCAKRKLSWSYQSNESDRINSSKRVKLMIHPDLIQTTIITDEVLNTEQTSDTPLLVKYSFNENKIYFKDEDLLPMKSVESSECIDTDRPNPIKEYNFTTDPDSIPIFDINEESIEFRDRKSDLIVRIKDDSDYSICDEINSGLIPSSDIFGDSNVMGKSIPIPAYFDKNILSPVRTIGNRKPISISSSESILPEEPPIDRVLTSIQVSEEISLDIGLNQNLLPNKFLSVQFNPDSDRFPIIEINEESIEFKVQKSDLTVRIKDYSDYSICDDINGDLIPSSEIFEDSNMTGQSVPIPAYFDENHLLPNKVLRVHSSGDLRSTESPTEFVIPNPHITNHQIQTLSSEGLTEIFESTHLICQKLVEDSRGYTEKRKPSEETDQNSDQLNFLNKTSISPDIDKNQKELPNNISLCDYIYRDLTSEEPPTEFLIPYPLITDLQMQSFSSVDSTDKSSPTHMLSRKMVEDLRGYTEKRRFSEVIDRIPKSQGYIDQILNSLGFSYRNLICSEKLIETSKTTHRISQKMVEDSRGYTERRKSSVDTDQFNSMLFRIELTHPDKFSILSDDKQLIKNVNQIKLIPPTIVEDSRGYTEKMIFSQIVTEGYLAGSHQSPNHPANLKKIIFPSAELCEITEQTFINSIIFGKFEFYLNENLNKRSSSVKTFRFNVMLENITLFTKVKFEKYRPNPEEKLIYCYGGQQ